MPLAHVMGCWLMRSKPVRKVQSDAVQVFAERLKSLRKKRGLSQQALSNKASVNLSYLNKLETGQSSPSLDILTSLAAALKVTVGELCDGPRDAREPLTAIRAQAREHLEKVLSLGDADSLQMLTTLGSLLANALARNR